MNKPPEKLFNCSPCIDSYLPQTVSFYGIEFLILCFPAVAGLGACGAWLDDPSKKMSKSNPNQASYILMLDETAAIRKKFSRAVTDSDGQVRYDWKKPAVSNLVELYAVFGNLSIPGVERRFDGQGCKFGRTGQDSETRSTPCWRPKRRWDS
ncbi:hypothetical protein [Saccharibacillus deserti]|uniref:hypothetical protein n=1 Tax=Saccharibacillus deserti TaxID=1634444 RepID=UPI0031B5693A